jgi:hypothetical protein
MKVLGWLIIILEIIGYTVFPDRHKYVIVDVAFILSATSLIIIDRLKPNTKAHTIKE